MKWDAALYDKNHGFVADYGRSLVSLVNIAPGQDILDLGCGTGTLTAEMAAGGARVLGVDSSAEMVEKAKGQYPQLPFAQQDATRLPYENAFDTVFSNAVFHWIDDQPALLAGICRALKPGGRLICEFGAQGNVQTVRAAFDEALAGLGLPPSRRFFLPSPEAYAALLAQAGLTVLHIEDYDRPTPLADGEDGLAAWMRQFFAADLARMDAQTAADVLDRQAQALRPHLFRKGQWVLDYRRLRAIAQKPDA